MFCSCGQPQVRIAQVSNNNPTLHPQTFCSTTAPGSADPPSRLGRNFTCLLTAKILYGICQFALTVLIAKLGNAEMLGAFALALAITAPVMILSELGLRVIQASDARGEYRFQEYFSLRIVTVSVGFTAIVMIALSSQHSGRTLALIAVVAAAKAFESLSDVTYGLMQLRDRITRVALSITVKSVLSLIVLGTLLFATRDIVWAGAGLFATWACMFFCFDLPVALRVSRDNARATATPIGTRVRRIASLAKLGVPLGIVAIADSLTVNAPRYFIEGYHGRAALGYYAAVAYFAIVPARVVTALGEAIVARLGRHHSVDTRGFVHLAKRFVGAVAGLGIAGIGVAALAGSFLLGLLYRAEYSQFSNVLVLIMVYAGISSTATAIGYVMSASRQLRAQAMIGLASVGLAILASRLLIPRHGLIGAAWALCIAASLQLLASMVALAHNRAWCPASIADTPRFRDRCSSNASVYGQQDRGVSVDVEPPDQN
jgi:O-antigen/teichoic acid export membrane protein